MRKLLCGFFLLLSLPPVLLAQAVQKPLQALPYTPSLDVNAMDTTIVSLTARITMAVLSRVKAR